MWVADCQFSTITSLVEFMFKLYQWASLQVTEVCANHKLKPVLQVVQDDEWSFMTNLANAQEHVPEASAIITSLRSIFAPLIMGSHISSSHIPLYATW